MIDGVLFIHEDMYSYFLRVFFWYIQCQWGKGMLVLARQLNYLFEIIFL